MDWHFSSFRILWFVICVAAGRCCIWTCHQAIEQVKWIAIAILSMRHIACCRSESESKLIRVHPGAIRFNLQCAQHWENFRNAKSLKNVSVCKLNVTRGKCKIYIQPVHWRTCTCCEQQENGYGLWSVPAHVHTGGNSFVSCDAVRKNVNDVNELMWKSKNAARAWRWTVELYPIRWTKETFLHFSRCILFFFFFLHTFITIALRLSRFCSFHPLYHARTNVLALVDADEWTISFGSRTIEQKPTQKPISNPSIALFYKFHISKKRKLSKWHGNIKIAHQH